MVDLGIFLRGQFALKAIPEAIENLALTLVHLGVLMPRPELDFEL